MSAKDEIAKATERGLEVSETRVELEEAREAFHKARKSKAARERFKAAQQAHQDARLAKKLAREAAGPPQGADAKYDANGRVMGWQIGGDAVAAPGGGGVA